MTLAGDLIDEARIARREADRESAKAANTLALKSREFRKGREDGWRDLEDLVQRVERRGVHALSLDELERLPILYRAALSSLSVARTIALDRNLLLYLENLALRAYLAVYGPRVDPVELLSATGTFLAAMAALISVYSFIFDETMGRFEYMVGSWWMLGVAMQIGAGVAGRAYVAAPVRR